MAKNTIYFLEGYNNYYNRVLKFHSNLDSYIGSTYPVFVVSNNNFVPGDSINAQGIFNLSDDFNPDYCLVVSQEGSIVSRWFVMESVRTVTGQYRVALKRDVLADNLTVIKNAPTYVERGTLSTTDPFIYNLEDITFNQIKTSETLLKDRLGIPWIVGYYAHTTGEAVTTLQAEAEYRVPVDVELTGDISTWNYYQYVKDNILEVEYFKATYAYPGGLQGVDIGVTYDSREGTKTLTSYQDFVDRGNLVPPATQPTAEQLGEAYSNAGLLSNLNNAWSIGNSVSYELWSQNGKIIRYFSEGVEKYAKVNVTNSTYTSSTQGVTVGTSTFNVFNNAVTELGYTGTANNNTYEYVISGSTVTVSLEDYESNKVSVDITANRYYCTDAPYDVFAIPYGDRVFKNPRIQVSKDVSIRIATALAEKYAGSGTLYDLQLLPYCPYLPLTAGASLGNNPLLYTPIKDTNGSILSFCLHITNTKGSFNIPLRTPITVTEPKVQQQCDKYRLCSPNYNGQFEFNAVYNGGISSFNVDFTYKPYSPYIHVNPVWGGLYGGNYGDARGLICQGDFSLPVISDQFKTYEITNKNYSEIFGRQIQNMEVTQKYNRMSNIASTIAGTASGVVSGAGLGSLVGGPGIGTVAGAITGGIASAAGGIADIFANEALYKEQKAYTTDMYNYNLGNIKALPDSLLKVGAFTSNNKIFPVLEYYTCTDREKEAFREYLKYRGMAVGRVGRITDYVPNDGKEHFVKGNVIRVNGLVNDNHMAAVLSSEIDLGFFTDYNNLQGE